jgi:antitoxin component YwqK of YwqJK toxin-antitoxin module
MKKIVSLLLCVFALSLVACGGGGEARRESASKMEARDDIVYISGESKPYTGILFVMSDTDVLIEEGTYKNGKLNGTRKEWSADGQLTYIESYKNNVKDGTWQTFFPNGKVKTELTYKNGLLNGLSKVWNEDGNIIVEGNYKNDKKNGISKIWSPKGFMLMEGTFKDDVGHGVFKKWDENGNYEGQAMYEDGKLVE